MGKKRKSKYEAVCFNPRQFASIRSSDGQPDENIEIMKDKNTEGMLLQCPICLFCVSYANRSAQLYLMHKDSENCKRLKHALDMEQQLLQNEREVEEALRVTGLGGSSSSKAKLSGSSVPHIQVIPPFPEIRLNHERLPGSSPEPSSPPIAPYESDAADNMMESIILEGEAREEENHAGFEVVDEADMHEDDSQADSANVTIAVFTEVGLFVLDSWNPCKGQAVRWTNGSVWSTYAFQQHEDANFLWKPIGFQGDNILVLRSKNCSRALATNKEKTLGTCAACYSLLYSHTLEMTVSRSKEAKPHTPYKYLSMAQLSKVTLSKREENVRIRSEIINLKVKIDDGRRMLMKLASQDIPGASRILHLALKRGESVEVILRKLEGAISGAFRPHGNWSQRELDIAFLAKAMGGPRMLYVLQNANHFPSATTLRRHKTTPQIIICVDEPTDSEIRQNIRIMFGLGGREPTSEIKGVGWVLMIDDIALEEVPRYDALRNLVLGFCREHSCGQSKHINTFEDLKTLREGLDSGKWHYCKRATVFALAPNTGAKNYYTTPFLITGCCGTEKGDKIAETIRRVIRNWNAEPDGRERHGEIVQVATDGEASFRGARYTIGLTQDVIQGADKLCGLKGFNVRTGPNDLLTNCDPKHIFKRFAQMLRSYTLKIQLGDAVLTYADVRFALRASGVADERITQLLNPQDKQNVPVALDLLKELRNSKIQNPAHANPGDAHRVRLVRFYAEVVSNFVVPFTDPNLGLAEQVRKLSTYAHLVYVLYRRHRQKFMKGALYGDSMSIVKSIVILVARWQTHDGEIRFYIIWVGTDRLEGVFSHVRTQDHARNCDIIQLSNKACIGAEINRIMQLYPELDRGHDRRDIKDSYGQDHINAASWDKNADVRVGSVVLSREWNGGGDDAAKMLLEMFGWVINWEKEFSDAKLRVDILRPFGQYVGSRAAGDRVEGTADAEEDAEEDDFQESSPQTPLGEASSQRDSGVDTEEQVPELPTDGNMIAETEEEVLGVDSDVLDPVGETPHSKYLIVDGKRLYKSSICPRYLMSTSSRKVVIRQFRAAGMTVRELTQRPAVDSVTHDTPAQLGNLAETALLVNKDLAAFLCRCEGTHEVALAVLEILYFQQGTGSSSKQHFEIERAQLGKDGMRVVGQVIELGYDAAHTTGQWVWTHKYADIADGQSQEQHVTDKRAADKRAVAIDTTKRFTVTIPSTYLRPLRPGVRLGSTPEEHAWSLDTDQLEKSAMELWQLLNPGSDEMLAHLDSLPKFTSTQLPYCRNGEATFVIEDGARALKKRGGDETVPCFLCGAQYKLKLMRNHVGGHIVKALRGMPDTSLQPLSSLQNSFENPCGWCGRASQGCKTHFKSLGGGRYSILSNCDYHYDRMSYGSACRFSKPQPCTNVPVVCTLCKPLVSIQSNQLAPTFWKYNLKYHLAEEHVQSDATFPLLPAPMILSTYISKEEESALGVTEEKTDEYRDSVNALPSEDISQIQSQAQSEEAAKRARANSASAPQQGTKKKAKRSKR